MQNSKLKINEVISVPNSKVRNDKERVSDIPTW